MNTLRAIELSKQYKSRHIVKNVSLHLNRGEIVGLLGPNGAGKTTSFYMMVGLIQCNHGHIFLDDEDITSLPVHARAKVERGLPVRAINGILRLFIKGRIQRISSVSPEFEIKITASFAVIMPKSPCFASPGLYQL